MPPAWFAFRIYVFVALWLLMPSRLPRLRLSLGLDGLMVRRGAAAVAAAVVIPELTSLLGAHIVANIVTLIYPGSRPDSRRDVVVVAGGRRYLFVFVGCTDMIQAAHGTYQSGALSMRVDGRGHHTGARTGVA